MELRNFAAWLNQKSIDIQRFGRKSLDIYSLAEDLVKEKKKNSYTWRQADVYICRTVPCLSCNVPVFLKPKQNRKAKECSSHRHQSSQVLSNNAPIPIRLSSHMSNMRGVLEHFTAHHPTLSLGIYRMGFHIAPVH